MGADTGDGRLDDGRAGTGITGWVFEKLVREEIWVLHRERGRGVWGSGGENEGSTGGLYSDGTTEWYPLWRRAYGEWTRGRGFVRVTGRDCGRPILGEDVPVRVEEGEQVEGPTWR